MTKGLVTSHEITDHLWEAAHEILDGTRESVRCVLGMSVLKRASDQFAARRDRLVQEWISAGKSREEAQKLAEDARDEYGACFVPKKARWQNIRIAHDADSALKAIDRRSSWQGALEDFTFEHCRDSFAKLLAHFQRLPLDCTENVLGEACDEFLKRVAESAGKNGDCFVPEGVARTLVELIKPTATISVCDPTVGWGQLLVECARYVQRSSENPEDMSMHGQDDDIAIAAMNASLHNLAGVSLHRQNAIREPLTESGRLVNFDVVVGVLPFAARDWAYENAKADPHDRFWRGLPPKTRGDMAYLQHMVETCKEGGIVGAVVPNGVLFRGANEGKIRRKLVEEDFFEAVVGLPENLFVGTDIPTSILVLNKNKPEERRGRVLVINAENCFERDKKQNRLRDEDILRIVAVFNSYATRELVSTAVDETVVSWCSYTKSTRHDAARVAGFEQAALNVNNWSAVESELDSFGRVVSLDEIARNDFSLNVHLYLHMPFPKLDIDKELLRLARLVSERNEAEMRTDELIRELGCLS